MYTDLKNVKKIVMGNGREGLDVSVPRLADNVGKFELTVANLDRNVDKMTQRLDKYEGERVGKEEMRKRTRWIIGTLITVAVFLAGTIITLLLKGAT